MLLSILIADALAGLQLAAVSEAQAARPRPPAGDPPCAPPHAPMLPILQLPCLEAAIWAHPSRWGWLEEVEAGWMRPAQRAPCQAAWPMQFLGTRGMRRGDPSVHLQLCFGQSACALPASLVRCN